MWVRAIMMGQAICGKSNRNWAGFTVLFLLASQPVQIRSVPDDLGEPDHSI